MLYAGKYDSYLFQIVASNTGTIRVSIFREYGDGGLGDFFTAATLNTSSTKDIDTHLLATGSIDGALNIKYFAGDKSILRSSLVLLSKSELWGKVLKAEYYIGTQTLEGHTVDSMICNTAIVKAGKFRNVDYQTLAQRVSSVSKMMSEDQDFSSMQKAKSLASKAKKLRKQDSEVAELLTVMAYITYAVFSGTTKLSVVGDSLVKDIDLDTYEIGAIFNKMFGGVQDIHAILSCIGDKNTCFDYLFGKRPGFDQYCEELEDLIESTKFGATLQSSTGPISFSDLAGKAKSTITRSRQKRDKYFESMGFDMSGGKDMRNNVVTMPGVQLNEVGNNRVAPQVVSRSNMQPTSSYRQQVVNTETPRTILGKEQIASFMSKVVAVSATGVKTTFSIPEINIQNQDFVMFSYYEECVGPTKMQECWQFRSDLKKALKAGPLKATFVIHSGNGVAATLDLGEFLKLDDNRKYGNKYAKNLYSFRKEEFAANDVEYAKSQVAGTTVSKKKSGADISDPFDSLDDSGKSVFWWTGTTTVKHIEKDPYADDLDFETKSVFN